MSKRIVILGGGFGGIYAAKRLLRKAGRDIEIILINRKNYILYTPMLHEVATGGLNRHTIVEPIRSVLRGKQFQFWQCEAKRIDFAKREIQTGSGKLRYDLVLIATGSKPNFFLPGAAMHALPLKTIGDANRIRNRVVDLLEQTAKKPRTLSFAVVGGGPTGAEMMGELVEFVEQLTERYRTQRAKFTLIHAANRLVPQAHSSSSSKIQKQLERMGVVVRLNTKVKAVAMDHLELEHGKLEADLIIWTAGIRSSAIPGTPQLTDARGKYPVNEFLQVIGAQHAYAIGDCAAIADADGKTVPDLAQAAVAEGKAVAENILMGIAGKPQRPFRFRQNGFLVSVGRRYAIAEIGSLRFSGFLAWWLMRTIYLFKMVGTAQKFRVAFEWTIQLFSDRDATQI